MSGINTELYFTGLFSLFWNIFQNAICRVWNCRRLTGLETVRADNLVRLLWFAVNVCSSSWPRLYAVLTCNPESKTQWKLCVAQLKFILILVPNASPLSAPHSPSSSSAEQRRRFFSTFASFFSLHFFLTQQQKWKNATTTDLGVYLEKAPKALLQVQSDSFDIVENNFMLNSFIPLVL